MWVFYRFLEVAYPFPENTFWILLKSFRRAKIVQKIPLKKRSVFVTAASAVLGCKS